MSLKETDFWGEFFKIVCVWGVTKRAAGTWTAELVFMIDRYFFALKCCLYARKQTCNHTAIKPYPLLHAIEVQTTVLGILELVKQYIWNAIQSQKIIRYHGCAVLSLSGPISCVKWHFLLFAGHLTKMRWAGFFHYITSAICERKTVASEGQLGLRSENSLNYIIANFKVQLKKNLLISLRASSGPL